MGGADHVDPLANNINSLSDCTREPHVGEGLIGVGRETSLIGSSFVESWGRYCGAFFMIVFVCMCVGCCVTAVRMVVDDIEYLKIRERAHRDSTCHCRWMFFVGIFLSNH